jgi:predicted transposase YbfD/YdcC
MPPSPGNAHTLATDIGEIRPGADLPRDRLRLLLKEFAALDDAREPWRVLYPLHEVLLLVTCATIASCDDFDDIVAWGTHHLAVLRRFSPFHHGIPGERWLRALVNRVDPLLFGRCFESWIAALWPNRHDLIAIDGKTARRTHDRRSGLKALHTLSAYATNARLTLAQLSVPEKTNEITAIPDLLDLLAEAGQLKGALVTIDAMGCQVEIADRIVAHKADYVLTLKGNQPSLEAEVAAYFRTAPAEEIVTTTTVEKGHGRIEIRTYKASSCVDWIRAERSYPGAPRFTSIKTLIQVHRRTEHADRCSFDTHHYISSAALDIARLAQAVRGHWGVESMHWLLDVAFGDDLSRYRGGHGAKNMATVRRFALGLVRANPAKASVKTRRKTASWNPEFLLQVLQLPAPTS